MSVGDILPHLLGGPVVLCYELEDTPRLRSAIAALFKKYPNITLACVDHSWQIALEDERRVNVLISPFMDRDIRKNNNVIGILCGSDRVFPDDGLKVMRV